MSGSIETKASGQRIHFLDSARALFMLLGVPFHAALAYTAAPWLVQSPDSSALLSWLPPLLNGFRMPGFFLIAGYFAALLLERRSPGEWLRARSVRLGIPLLTGMALIVPLQNAMLRAAPAGSIRMPESASGLLLSHLWFLPVLLMLCAGLALVWKPLGRLPLPNAPLWLLGLAIGIWAVGLRSLESLVGFNFTLLDGMLDVQTALRYAPYFLLGVIARRNARFFARLLRFDAITLVLGLAALAVFALDWEPQTSTEIVLGRMAGAMAAVCISQSVLALLARVLDRPSQVVDRLVDASFTVYLLHHPIVIGMAILLLAVSLPPVVEWAIVVLVALGLSYAIHRLFRNSPLLLFLFNGVQMRHGEGVLLAASARRPS